MALVAEQSFSGNVYGVDCITDIEKIIHSKSVHCIIFDPTTDTMTTLDVLSRVVAMRPNIYNLAYSSSTSLSNMTFYDELNILGVISKLDLIKTFESAIVAAANGYAFKKNTKSHSINKVTLSSREIMVLTLLSEGHHNKEVARRLEFSDKTVSTFKRRVLDKFEAENIMDLLSKPEVNQALMIGCR